MSQTKKIISADLVNFFYFFHFLQASTPGANIVPFEQLLNSPTTEDTASKYMYLDIKYYCK